MAMQDLVIYGAGGFAREVAWLARSIEGRWRVAALVDDDPAAHGRTINGFPVMGLESARAGFPQAALVAAVGDPGLREKLVGRGVAVGFACATLVHPRTEMSEWVEVGEGTVICAGNLLTTNIVLGRHVQIGLFPTPAAELPISRVIRDELEVLGVHGLSASRFGQIFELMDQGRLHPEAMITQRLALADVPRALPAMGSFGQPGVSVVTTM